MILPMSMQVNSAMPTMGLIIFGVLNMKVLAMIGEQFAESDEICGAVVSIRARVEKLALWTKTASNEAAQVANLTDLTNGWPEL